MNYKLNIIFILLSCSSLAQGGWRKNYHLQNSFVSICRNVIETPGKELIMVGLSYDTIGSSGARKLSIVGTDQVGTMLWRKDYGNSKFEYLDNVLAPNAAIVQDGNFFYHTLCARDSNNKYIGVLIKFNYNGDTLWQKIYKEPTATVDLFPQAIAKSVDGGFLITGCFQDWVNTTRACLLIKTDNNGNELWRKKIYKAVPNTQDGRSIVQDSASKKIIIVGYQYIGSSTYQETYSNILILDSLGNKLLQTSFNNGEGGPFCQVIQLQDKNFLTCGSMNRGSIGNMTLYQGVLVKFDLNGTVLWSKSNYDTVALFTGMVYMQELDNRDIVVLGELDNGLLYDANGCRKLRLYKMDKDGNLKWKKHIGGAYTYTANEFPRSFNQTQDGGFVISAWMLNASASFKPPYRIIKTDSTGCDTLDSWCKSVILDVSEFSKAFGYSSEIFPNPADNIVNIKLAASIAKDFMLKLTDINGNEVEVFHIGSNQNFKLNTTNYKNGFYLLSIFLEERKVETKKVVVNH